MEFKKLKESKKIELSVVLACYNEMEHITKSLDELIEFLDNTKLNYELILIDDYSIDGTREEIKRLVKVYPKIRWYLHEKNIGRGGTVAEGIKLARGDVVGFIDIDLEISPEYILPAHTQIKKGYDVVIARRIFKFKIKNIDRLVTHRGYNFLMRKMLNIPFLDTEAGFKFFNRKKIIPILDEVKDKKWFWDTEIIVRSYHKGYKIKLIPTLFIKRNNKTSTVKIFRDSLYYFNKLAKFRKEIKGLRK